MPWPGMLLKNSHMPERSWESKGAEASFFAVPDCAAGIWAGATTGNANRPASPPTPAIVNTHFRIGNLLSWLFLVVVIEFREPQFFAVGKDEFVEKTDWSATLGRDQVDGHHVTGFYAVF